MVRENEKLLFVVVVSLSFSLSPTYIYDVICCLFSLSLDECFFVLIVATNGR